MKTKSRASKTKNDKMDMGVYENKLNKMIKNEIEKLLTNNLTFGFKNAR